MKKAGICALLMIGWLALTGSMAAMDDSQSTEVEKGRFIIYYRGQEAGYENYSFSRQAGGNQILEAESELRYPKGSGSMLFQYRVKLTMDGALNPLQYDDTFWVNGQESYLHLDFSNGVVSENAFMGGRMLNRTTKVKPQSTVLEEAVYSLYIPLLKRYLLGKGETQNLPVYIAKVAVELTAQFRFTGQSSIQAEGGEIPVRRYLVTMGDFHGVAINTNQQNQIMQMIIPKMELQIVRDLAYDARPATEKGQPAVPPPATEK